VSDDRSPAPTIDDAAVAHVARLSRLELTAEERRLFRAQLGSILESFQRLTELDLGDTTAAGQADPTASALRDDRPVPSLPREQALANAPVVEDGYVVVPPVIEGAEDAGTP
jgi:aspartyl-tRNA(Asn)/glutamyl-tRNA(Gln) amidotransferase subunit C